MPFQDAPPAPPAAPQVLVNGKPITSPNEIYSGLVHQRTVLGDQMRSLQDDRREVTRQLSGEDASSLNAADKAGLEKRLTTLDQRIEGVEKQIASADAQVASAAAVPGAVVDPKPYVREGPPEEVWILSGIFLVVAIFPISLAYARRVWRRSAKVVASIPSDIVERFSQLDQAVESIAVEVERIGEGQRFVTRVLTEQGGRAALGEGAARPGDVRAREAQPVSESRRTPTS